MFYIVTPFSIEIFFTLILKTFQFFLVTQRELDVEAAGMGQRQDESEAARKQLIELSREFKKSATEVNISISFKRGRGYMKREGHQYSRTSASFDCSIICVCVGKSFVDYQWNESGQDRFYDMTQRSFEKEFRVGRMSGRISIHFQQPPAPLLKFQFCVRATHTEGGF